ncbi:MAG: CBASS cGAMP-activated phospholipase [Bacteroidota bacterium]|nr:CBASS cGAMP-activated phospholipase [Bacteroidota bacterium]MDE2957829.1 CBASS cGAMP-activated phospholipase [Bacteroidota bacterium]
MQQKPALDESGVERTRCTQRFRILALDGGGVRGVCTAAYLARLEEIAGSPVRRFFDLICGTSAGGIIAIAIALDVPAKEIFSLFRNKTDDIFSRRHPKSMRLYAALRDSLYRSGPFHGVLRDVLGSETKLGAARCRLCIPAVNIATGRVTVFKTRHEAYLVRDYLLKAWQIAAATSAAPIYFSPFRLRGVGEYVDGGIWANCPTVVAITEALRMDFNLDAIDLLSIGTGSSFFQRSVTQTWLHRLTPFGSNGLLGWNTDLVTLSMQAQTDSGENVMNQLLGESGHLRIQFSLPDRGFDLDATDKVGRLSEIAHEEAKASAESTARRFLNSETDPFVPVPENNC